MIFIEFLHHLHHQTSLYQFETNFLNLTWYFKIHHLHIFWVYWHTLNGEFVMIFVDSYRFYYIYLTFLSVFRWSNMEMWWSVQCLILCIFLFYGQCGTWPWNVIKYNWIVQIVKMLLVYDVCIYTFIT